MAENKKDNWEQKTIEKIASSSLIEQRRSRRWGIFFKLITLLYIGIIIYGFNSMSHTTIPSNEKITALVKLNGVIGSNLEVNADDVINGLREAYAHQGTEAIIISINSPGGSPVQAGIINDEINRYKLLHPNIPIYAVVEDICASGGYYIASCSGTIGRNGSSMPLFLPAVNNRRSTPIFLINSSKPKPSIRTPIEPTILALFTNIWSAATAI